MSAARRIVAALGVACCLWGGLGQPASAASTPTPSPTPTVTPCAGDAAIIAQTFAPASVMPGGQSSEAVTIMNCGSAPRTVHLQWTALWSGADGSTVPAGCPIFDPLVTALALPAGGRATASLGYRVPAGCTATHLTGFVSATDANGVAGSAVLQITGPSDCPSDAKIVAQAFTPPAILAGGSATENVTIVNCGSTALNTPIQWYALPLPPAGSSGFPAGCAAYDPIQTPVSIPVGATVTVSRQFTVPATCTAAALRATVSLPGLPGTPSGDDLLTITPPSCTATLAEQTWPGGFTLAVTIAYQGPPLTGWTASYTFGGDQQVTNSWSATVTQVGATVTASNAPWNGTVANGASIGFGSQGTWRASRAAPTALLLNGRACRTTATVN